MTMREHMRDTHEKLAAHHVRMGKIHNAALKKAAMEDGDEEFHKGAMAEHAAMAEHHLECCKALDATHKAMDGGDSWPTGLSIITPEIPQNIRAVPRAGQREIMNKAEIAPGLEKVLGFDEIE